MSTLARDRSKLERKIGSAVATTKSAVAACGLFFFGFVANNKFGARGS